MTGILVYGDNHFIVRGPLPDRRTALALVRQWSIIRIGAPLTPDLAGWQIVTREFRENLRWAVVVAGDRDMIPAVAGILRELADRGITIHNAEAGCW